MLVSGVIVYVLVLIKLVVPTTNLLEEGHSAWTNAYADALQAVTNIQSVKHMATEEHEKEKIKKSFWAIQQHFGINSSLSGAV